MTERLTNEPGTNYEADKAAEEISNASRDKIENADEQAKKVYEETAKTPEEIKEKMGTAPKSRAKVAQGIKDKEKHQKEGQKKFEVDLDNYMQFVDRAVSYTHLTLPTKA